LGLIVDGTLAKGRPKEWARHPVLGHGYSLLRRDAKMRAKRVNFRSRSLSRSNTQPGHRARACRAVNAIHRDLLHCALRVARIYPSQAAPVNTLLMHKPRLMQPGHRAEWVIYIDLLLGHDI
jgi:hypothetical protein